MKRIIALILSFFVLCVSVGCRHSKVPTIGINQYGKLASHDNCREGFVAGLVESGLTEGKDFQIDYQNANSNNNVATEIAQNFSKNKVAIMCAIATPSATACYAAAKDKDIPVVFNAITDPEAANLTSGNITGVSDELPVDAQLRLIRELQPNAKTIGIIYTTSEPNSVSALAEYKDLAGMYGFIIEEIGVTSHQEVIVATDTLIDKNVDCFSNLTDNNVVDALPEIITKTNIANIPIYGSEIEQIKIGCVACAGIDYFSLGKEAGKMAASVLKKEKTAEEIQYKTVSEYHTYINSQALNSFGIILPESVAQKAIEAK